MHSTRIRTACSSSRQLWGGPPSVHAGIHPHPQCGPGDPLAVGLETPQVSAWIPPQVSAWRHPHPLARPLNLPLGCGPGDPLRPDLSTSPLGVSLETPPARPLKLPPGCGSGNLQGMLGYTHPPGDCKACWDTTCKACWDTTPSPPQNRITDTCKNITFPQLRLRAVMNWC